MQNRKVKRRAVRASTLNATIGKTHLPTIVPSVSTASFNREQATANLVACSCGACGFKFQSVSAIGDAKIEPICANCGSPAVTSTKVDGATIVEPTASLAAVQCPKCQTFQIQAAATAEALAAGCHCITCGEEQILTPDATTEDLEEDLPVEEESADVSSGEIQPDIAAGETPETKPDNVADSTTPTGSAPAPAAATTPPDSTTVAAVEDEFDEGSEDAFGVEDPLSDSDLSDLDEEFPAAAEAECDDDGVCTDDEVEDENPVDIQFSESTEFDIDEEGDQVQFELLPEDDESDTELSFVYVGDTLNAFANDLHVATLKKEHAGKNADLFNSDVLVRSIVAQCRESGIRKGLQTSGFKIIKVALPIKALVAKKLSAALASIKKEESAAVQVTAKDWEQSFAIALAGLNKNFFSGKNHPLRASLVTELSALGVRNPTKLVDKVFAAHGAKFNAAVLELATEIQGKPAEVRNQLAQTLDSANYIHQAEDESDDGDDDYVDGDDNGEDDETFEEQSVTARLNGSGHRIIKNHSSVQTASARPGKSRISEIVAGAGGSLFSKH